MSDFSIKFTVEDRYVEITVSGKLTTKAYDLLEERFEQVLREHGPIRILFVMTDFHGWTAGAMWRDLKFDLRHHEDFDRAALVGDKAWEQAMSVLCRPLLGCALRFFQADEIDAARAWLRE